MEKYSFSPIGIAHSPFKEKFGVPRQSRLVPSHGTLELFPEFCPTEATRDLHKFSHIWIIFIFNQFDKGDWSPTARPPRLGGNKRVGLYASRSPRRPNRTGLSVVKLIKIERKKGRTFLHVEGLDLIEGTPIIDIKPYIPGSDSIPRAKNGWINEAEKLPTFRVSFSKEAGDFLKDRADFKKFITQVLRLDHRPAYYRSNAKDHHKNNFASRIEDVDIH